MRLSTVPNVLVTVSVIFAWSAVALLSEMLTERPMGVPDQRRLLVPQRDTTCELLELRGTSARRRVDLRM